MAAMAFDASTLILLAKTELLDLFLDNFPSRSFISESVCAESTLKETFDALLITGRIKEKKIIVKPVKNRKMVEKISKDFKLHLGEAETLVLCIENNLQLVGTDDYNAMKACVVLQIAFISAIGILIKLQEKKALNKKEALLKLEKLCFFGRYSEEIIKEARINLEE